MTQRRFYEGATRGAKRSAPAALRNREPIADVLAEWLPDTGLVLEIASGTGEHVVHFARRFPALEWQPSDVHEDALESVVARRAESALPNILPPAVINAAANSWAIDRADAVISINMAHISPWAASLGLINGAARILPDGGPFILYGPWLTDAIETAPSNLAFDQQLKDVDPAWGLRRVENFSEEAARRGLTHIETRRMPANNLMLLFRRAR
ncbi:MAG TPA: DUF938 domain-containing protein [Sphingomicrobium sp.]|nr:DUF938 domain-containing protein [Sphingomicrobium sp.]